MQPEPLEGLKVADFTWIGVGPVTIKYLGDHGATVVHVESNTRIDGLRLGSPSKDGQVGVNRSAFFANFNSSKYGVSLNLNHPKGREVAQRLIAWADVVAESFTPGTMAGWQLDYESVRRWKPEILYLSTCQLGQWGPWAEQPGFGTQLSGFSGFYHLASWPGGEPAGPYGAYTDFINPPLGALALLAALDYKRRTGRGLQIDLSQLEGGVQFLGPALMEYLNNGHDPPPLGNGDPQAVPHGAYPCQGENRWCVIAVFTDTQWEALRRAMGDPEWAENPQFATFSARRKHEAELDQRIGEWARGFEARHLMELLQSAGVPAGVVQSAEDLFQDPQLQHRGHFVYLPHPEIGLHAYDGIPFQLSRTPGRLRSPGPCLGEHNEFVYQKLLGMEPEEYRALEAQGVFE